VADINQLKSEFGEVFAINFKGVEIVIKRPCWKNWLDFLKAAAQKKRAKETLVKSCLVSDETEYKNLASKYPALPGIVVTKIKEIAGNEAESSEVEIPDGKGIQVVIEGGQFYERQEKISLKHMGYGEWRKFEDDQEDGGLNLASRPLVESCLLSPMEELVRILDSNPAYAHILARHLILDAGASEQATVKKL